MVEPCSFAAESMAVSATVSGERDAQAWATVQGDHWVKPGRRASSEDPSARRPAGAGSLTALGPGIGTGTAHPLGRTKSAVRSRPAQPPSDVLPGGKDDRTRNQTPHT